MSDFSTRDTGQGSSRAPISGNGSSNQPKSGNAGQHDQTPGSVAAPSMKDIAEQARAVGGNIKDTAVDLAASSVDLLKSQTADLVGGAKDIASKAGDRIQEQVNTQKNAGAEYVGNFANTLRRAAGEFDSEIPIAATYIRKAAAQVDSVSETVRNGNFNDLVRGTQSFAKKQPTAFLGLAVLAGFGIIRFLKSSSES